MPFGPYADMADCIAKNQDTENPGAYCAAIHKQITGEWPAQKHSKEEQESMWQAVKAALSKATASFTFAAIRTRSVLGVEVFAVGRHTDSTGASRDWTAADLHSMASRSEMAPLKIGHTDKAFNGRIAKALGVPVEMVTGDSGGQGQMFLGRTTRLYIKGDKLLADFEGVPEPLAELIPIQFNAVSAEIASVGGHPVLTGIALLGAEEPAVRELAGLGAARFKGLVYTYVRGKENDMEGMKAIAKAMGMPEDATVEAMVAKIKEMMEAKMTEVKTEDFAQARADLVAAQTALAVAQGQIKALEGQVKMQADGMAALEHERRVATYTKQAQGWVGIPGKPDDLGKTLADIEEKAGEATAKLVAEQYAAASKVASEGGVLATFGRSKAPAADSFEAMITRTMQERGVGRPEALVVLTREAPLEFKAYQARRNGGS